MGFDLPHNLIIKHRPNSFLHCLLLDKNDGLSKYQLSLYLKTRLGLPIPPPNTANAHRPCGLSLDIYGHHCINCKQEAGKAWKSTHDTVQDAIAHELRLLNVSVVE